MPLIKENWSDDQIKAVWNKGIIVPGYDSTKYRKDIAGAWMAYTQYGNINSELGWEIDHIRPQYVPMRPCAKTLRLSIDYIEHNS